MDVYTTHGAFSWSELVTPDPAKSGAFYGALFGWKIDPMPMPEGTYHVVKVGDKGLGGIMSPPPGAPRMPAAWGCYVTVDDVDRTLTQCVALGGSVVVPVMEVPGVGRMAVIRDPQGATLNVITYKM